MKRKLIALSRPYEAALRKFLWRSRPAGTPLSRSSLEAAQGLGRQALAMGLQTLDLARIHEQSLVTFGGGSTSDRNIRVATSKQARGAKDLRGRANTFFAEALKPIEESHLIRREAGVRSGQLTETMRRRTEKLAARNRLLRQRIVKRKTAAEALKKNGEHQKKLLKESVRLQQRLRRLTRLLLQTQENEREKISRALNDEIAQLLLGINARVLSLKADAAMSTKGRQKEIASTQRLVARSAKTMHRVVRGFERSSQAARPRKPAHEHSMKWSRPILRAQVTGP